MLHPVPPTPFQPHRHHIESVRIAGPPMPLAPHLGHPDDGSPLAPPHTLGGRTPRDRAPRLHLDEGHCRAPPRHQIELLMPQAEAMCLDGPAAAREIRDGDPFAPPATPLPMILPL